MKKLFTFILILSFSASFAQVAGTWKMSPQAAALGVGPGVGDVSWWANGAGDIVTRACYFDDEYVFEEDGTFHNVQQSESWIEPWQGMDPEACGAPVAPHDGSNASTWNYDAGAGTLTLTGVGAYLGLAKVFNGNELTAEGTVPPASITYLVQFNATNDTMTVDIAIADPGYWRFILTTNAGGPPPPGDAVTLPVTFDDPDVDYRLTDFGGTTSAIIDDNGTKVVQTVRSDAAEVWAGTTVAEPEGIVPAIPFTAGSTTMSMRVYSPEAGLPILFKLEVWDNTSVFAEVTANTTVANTWETINFDFSTAEGFDLANPYNKPVIFFNFGVAGADAGEMTFMWDDIEFIDASSINDNEYLTMQVYPNPAIDVLNIENASDYSSIKIYSVTGSMVYESEIVNETIDISSFNKGVYFINATGVKGEPYAAKIIVN